ncbi:MAG: hypothetical protein AAB436_00760 [Patescibacteria group bacterium]
MSKIDFGQEGGAVRVEPEPYVDGISELPGDSVIEQPVLEVLSGGLDTSTPVTPEHPMGDNWELLPAARGMNKPRVANIGPAMKPSKIENSLKAVVSPPTARAVGSVGVGNVTGLKTSTKTTPEELAKAEAALKKHNQAFPSGVKQEQPRSQKEIKSLR